MQDGQVVMHDVLGGHSKEHAQQHERHSECQPVDSCDVVRGCFELAQPFLQFVVQIVSGAALDVVHEVPQLRVVEVLQRPVPVAFARAGLVRLQTARARVTAGESIRIVGPHVPEFAFEFEGQREHFLEARVLLVLHPAVVLRDELLHHVFALVVLHHVRSVQRVETVHSDDPCLHSFHNGFILFYPNHVTSVRV